MSFYPLQAQNFSLAGAGCSIGDTVLNLKSFKDINGVNITMAVLGSIAYLTIEPGNGTQEEQISFSGVTQNSDGSAQLTGVKTVLFKTPYTETSGIAVTHPGSVVAILTNTAAFYEQFAILSNDEAITGAWTAPDPIAAQGVATKAYVLSVVNGGAVSTDQVVVAGSAGENLTTGNIVYLKNDGAWWKASSATAATCLNVQLGIAQSTITVGNTVPVLVAGLDKTQSGLVAGTAYYLSTAGALSTSAGTIAVSIGEGITGTNLQFKPGYLTGNATASVTAVASMIPIASSGSSKLDSSWIPFKFGGTGADGALSITSGTTTIDLANAAVVVKNYTSISITGTGQLAFSNPNTSGTIIVLKSQGNVTLTSSTIPNVNASSLGGAGGASASSAATGGSDGNNGNDATLLFTTHKGTAGNQTPTAGTGGVAISLASYGLTALIQEKYPNLFIGAGGGSGAAFAASGSGTANSGVGGTGGAGLIIECAGAWNFTSTLGVSVAGGSGGNGNNTTLTSATSAGGGGGGGGCFIGLYNTLTANSGTVNVAAGTGGNTAKVGGGNIGGDAGGGGGGGRTAGSNGATTNTDGAKTGGDGGLGFSFVALNTEFS